MAAGRGAESAVVPWSPTKGGVTAAKVVAASVSAVAVRAWKAAAGEAGALRAEVGALGDALSQARERITELEAGGGCEAVVAPPARPLGARRLTAGATQEEWKRAIRAAKRAVRIAAFTFDLQDVVDACVDARRREVEVKLMYSYADRNTTKNQESRLQALRSVGCQVRGWRGSRLHAKWLLADTVFVVGAAISAKLRPRT